MKIQDKSSDTLIIRKEGLAKFYIFQRDHDSIPSKSMNVFYNKKMEINRDISSLAIKAYNKLYNQDLVIVDSMAASGISSIRLLLECENIKKLYINDINPVAVELIKKNLALNELDADGIRIEISRKDSNFLLSEIAQDNHLEALRKANKPNVISIDPFGTPNLYINSAFNAIQRSNGLICITATDTAVLFGIRPKACIRKYMSKPLHNDYCKEIGARILIYFISRMANVNKLGIIPLLTFYSNHFIRVFALTIKDKKKISDYFNSYGYILHCKRCNYRRILESNILALNDECPNCKSNEHMDFAGPLWIDELHDENFVKEVIKFNALARYSNKNQINKILNILLEEINMPISYINIHKLCQELNLQAVPKMDDLIKLLQEQGFKASRTHFDFTSIKTNMELESTQELLLKTYKK
jgi:tRNA (guanine26-N2/guanine27-N2)-dimethyltransferase